MNSWDDWAWLAGLAFLGALEVVTLVRSVRGDTLSEHVWMWLGVRLQRDPRWPDKTPNAKTKLARIAVLGFLAWLIVHFATGGWV